ncbi:MAG: hypothetical protein PHN32_03970 [Actinomycetota bacterium]|nr:hypothetical protein [Actinomycetota bacterium]
MTDFIILGAFTLELKGLLKLFDIQARYRFQNTRIYNCSYAGKKIILAVTGMGRDNASRGAAQVIPLIRNQKGVKVIVAGISGAGCPQLRAGQVVYYKTLDLLARKQGRMECQPGFTLENLPKPGLLPVRGATATFLAAGAEDKQTAYRQFGVEAVDMESYFFLKQDWPDGTKFVILRAISDTAGQSLPAFLSAFSQQKMGTGLKQAAMELVRPSGLRRLKHIYSNSKAAVSNLTLEVKKQVSS